MKVTSAFFLIGFTLVLTGVVLLFLGTCGTLRNVLLGVGMALELIAVLLLARDNIALKNKSFH